MVCPICRSCIQKVPVKCEALTTMPKVPVVLSDIAGMSPAKDFQVVVGTEILFDAWAALRPSI